mmetsp:Transcript_6795/g.16887  ORF Transcript_6795/g.16887 Transcript_6795/m.16887 type:complete len:115 (-) Transcript_6795:134-478(-)
MSYCSALINYACRLVCLGLQKDVKLERDFPDQDHPKQNLVNDFADALDVLSKNFHAHEDFRKGVKEFSALLYQETSKHTSLFGTVLQHPPQLRDLTQNFRRTAENRTSRNSVFS